MVLTSSITGLALISFWKDVAMTKFGLDLFTGVKDFSTIFTGVKAFSTVFGGDYATSTYSTVFGGDYATSTYSRVYLDSSPGSLI